MTASTILVIGAAGRFAGLVVPELARRGAVVRGLVRDDAKAAVARARGAAEIAFGDLRDRASLDAALLGVDGVFHIGPAFAPDEAELGVAMVEAAGRAEVRRFVFSSVIQATNTALANHASKIPVEAALHGSGMQYTILQPTNLMQNIGAAWPGVLAGGVFAEPFPRTARVARVDYRDVAEAAAIALTGDRLAYGSFELCADGLPDREEIAALMSAALGRPVRAEEPSFADWVAMAKPPYDSRQLALLEKVFAHYAAHGQPGNGLVARAVLGREPRSLRGFIEELAAGR
ncbi:NmrA family NAD(P)-binding protein [Inquilinus sp. NPDC058860]|uniref:NmrA family NAD(P)-binding protein n=1 Tax=Inquilinus sp. NPDC058860 TaxID=3346652 RepID=UPI003676EE66